MRRLLLIPIFVPQLFALYTFLTKCITLQDPFYFHPDATSLKVLEQANNDFGIPIFIIRVMHNKFVQSLIDSFYHFLQYIEPFFYRGSHRFYWLDLFLFLECGISLQREKSMLFF